MNVNLVTQTSRDTVLALVKIPTIDSRSDMVQLYAHPKTPSCTHDIAGR